MGKIYSVFDKYCIIDIIVGFIAGFYMAVHHNDSQLWVMGTIFVIIFAFIITLIPIGVAVYSKVKDSEEISIAQLVEAYLLNLAMTAVCFGFGFVGGSLYIGNYIPDNGLLF
ncbi:MAG: hypothetical protein IJQ68_04490 [Methanobrevibacter sp.]|uniref:hypothetical protein n=1 Tax=Methanobrevibacter sp. TaxID=66852 RepID=UPI0025E8AB35|nr:hypothetical protein [Methanobrevibacter sp.]MBR0271235.1 hypothetical protein [Methanobrevibacter sp.]